MRKRVLGVATTCAVTLALSSCATEPRSASRAAGDDAAESGPPAADRSADSRVYASNLRQPGRGLEALRAAFARNNPGYEIEYFSSLSSLDASPSSRIVFVQSVEAAPAALERSARAAASREPDASGRPLGDPGPMTLAELSAGDLESTSLVSLGDLIVVRRRQGLRVETPIEAVVFTVPESPDPSLPSFIRPDWDPQITDVVGGCATEEGAYRRILLTWLRDNGPYTFHALNAHRVRITDSFSHYHPVDGGFDELYLVQRSRPGARLLTSLHVDEIESPETVSSERARELFEEHELRAGDLIFLPRGVVHRGVGGALVQVITVPGFRPGAEIGVDHHLRAINERLSLRGAAALPYHEPASMEAVVR